MSKVRLNEPTIPYISNVTGTWITTRRGDQSCLLGHARQSHSQVQRCVACAVAVQESRFSSRPGRAGRLACWPCSILTGGMPEIRWRFPRSGTITNTSRTSNFSGTASARLWLSGAEIKWEHLHTGERPRRVPLPTYPFERQRLLAGAGSCSAMRLRPPDAAVGSEEPGYFSMVLRALLDTSLAEARRHPRPVARVWRKAEYGLSMQMTVVLPRH